MRAVIQRVSHACVKVETKTIGSIEKGYLILLGVTDSDTKEDVQRIVKKLVNLRIFSDENDKINLSIQDVKGSILVVSQFTLYADCKKGNRPSFVNAASKELANSLYEYFIEECKKTISNVQHGSFGAHMEVSLINDGPFTIILD
ncbi:MAG: D-tyrosyl-tRNA(Tyr) deacylase [Lachnospiraceae bacterium]|jgi:D-tyrosyl-tRNA(Tyr) deacylase|nr:D-tyrosyl-tRNA(Tyr) deacylase [Lachnospiraceae bacterium]